MHNLHPIKRKNKEKEDDDDSDEESDEDDEDIAEDPEKEPKLKIAALKHNGCINRVRYAVIYTSCYIKHVYFTRICFENCSKFEQNFLNDYFYYITYL